MDEIILIIPMTTSKTDYERIILLLSITACKSSHSEVDEKKAGWDRQQCIAMPTQPTQFLAQTQNGLIPAVSLTLASPSRSGARRLDARGTGAEGADLW